MKGLISLKRTKEELDSEKKKHETSAPADLYPWGIEIHLEDAELTKLGFDPSEVGSNITIKAKATVESISSSERTDGNKSRSVRLQITDMTVETPDKLAEDVLFDSE